MNIEQQKALALAEAKRRRAEAEASVGSQPSVGFGAALAEGWDSAGEAIGMGVEGIGQLTGSSYLQEAGAAQAAENAAQRKARNYQRAEGADGILSNLMEGDVWDAGRSIAYGVAENAAPVAAGVGATAGAILAAATAPVTGTGAAIATGLGAGAATLGTALGVTQSLGESRMEKADKGLNSDATFTDLGAAVTSGLVELVPVGKGAGFALKFTKEGLQELTQEGLVIGSTAIQGGEYVPMEVAERLFDAGVTGGLISKGAGIALNAADQGLYRASQAISDPRYDNEDYTDDDRRAAQRLLNAADGNMDVLGNVDDVEEGTARGAANAALDEIRGEAQVISGNLRSLAQSSANREAQVALASITKQIGKQSSVTPQHSVDRLIEAFDNHPDAQRLASLAKQMNRVQDFTKDGTRDIGGLSKYTRRLDITDKRNNLGLLTGVAIGTGSLGTAFAGTGINRIARAVDKRLNTRSRVKRFVDSATRDGRVAPEIQGQTALDSLQALKDLAKAEKARKQAAEARGRQAEREQERFMSGADPKPPVGAAQSSLGQLPEPNPARAERGRQAAVVSEATQAQKAEQQAALFKLNAANTAEMFETGVIPEGDDSTFNGYRRWQQATGMAPQDISDTLEQLEREGMVPKGYAQRFNEDIYSLSKDPLTYAIQRRVQQRANPDYVPKIEPKQDNKAPRVISTEQIVAQMNQRMANAKDRSEYKRLNGQKAGVVLDADIKEARSALNPDQLEMLVVLRQAIDRPDMTQAMRFKEVRETLPLIFPDNPALVNMWRVKFTDLAAAGNDIVIERKSEEQVQEEAKTEQFEKAKKQAVKRKSKAKKSAAKQPELQPLPTETTPEQTPESKPEPEAPADLADVALAKLNKPEQLSFDFDADPPSSATTAQDAEEPKITKPKKVRAVKPKAVEQDASVGPDPIEDEADNTEGKKKFADRLKARVTQIGDTLNLARDYGDALEAYIADIPPTVDGRVEKVFYEIASDQMTVNQVIEAYTDQINKGQTLKADVAAVAPTVMESLRRMEAAGLIKLIKPFRNEKLKIDGSYARDNQGKTLDVLQIEVLEDTKLYERFNIAQAIKMVDRTVPQEDPELDYGPNNQTYEKFSALKDIDPSRVDRTFQPIFDFLNSMRRQKLSVSDTMLTQIEEAAERTTERRVGTIGELLLPKSDKTNRRDEGPLRTVAQLLFQLGPKGERTSTLIRQEWGAGANLRVYSKNGLAHTQAGDIMKGILRFPTKQKVGGEKGLDYVFHGIGNLLGFDKQAPKVRRTIIFTNDMVDDLVSFAKDPFGRRVLKNDAGQTTKIGKMVKDGEGFFQVLNAAHEVKSMVDFARARYKGRKKLTDSELLQDPKVRADLAANYETDFIVQLDASNNAYQVAGMTMGYEDVLRATGLLPREGMEGDVDGLRGADIYLDPAKSIADRIPELKALVDLGLPDSKLRKIFKGPIGTYLYAAAFNSREKAFRDALNDLRGDAPLFSIDGGAGLIPIPQNVLDGLRSEAGTMFSEPKYDVEGEVKELKRVRKRIVSESKVTKVPKKVGKKVVKENGKTVYEDKLVTKFKVQTASGEKGKFSGAKKFDTEAEAIAYAYEMDLYVRMNDELIRDMNTRYPQMREYLNFAQVVSNIVKSDGKETVNVPTKDGMMLQYSFKKNPSFVGVKTQYGDKVLSLGLRTPDYKLAGRGLAAFMTHQNDAWALRETYKRMQEKGIKGFNPIHDSYGFHPSDASAGQETWVEVMQELGSPDYNLFLMILEANGINLEQFKAAGGNAEFILGRKGVKPVPAASIPTALS